MKKENMREFIYIPSFEVKWKKLGLTDDDLNRLEYCLLKNPKIGKVLEGSGGVRKMRFAFVDRGKSGSVRVIYVDFEVQKDLYLLDVFQKADKENLSKEEKNELKKVVRLIELSYEE
jgi:hypothetical protein